MCRCGGQRVSGCWWWLWWWRLRGFCRRCLSRRSGGRRPQSGTGGSGASRRNRRPEPRLDVALGADGRNGGRVGGVLQSVQDVLGCLRFTDSGKDVFEEVPICVEIPVCDRIDDDDNVVAVVVGAARGGFDAGAGRYAGDEDLGDAALAEVLVERCADERARCLLADEVVFGLLLQIGTSSVQPSGKEKFRVPTSVRPSAGAVTLTRTTVWPRRRKARARRADRSTISAAGCAVGRLRIPFCRSITIRAALISSVVRGMVFSFGSGLECCPARSLDESRYNRVWRMSGTLCERCLAAESRGSPRDIAMSMLSRKGKGSSC